MPNAMLKMSLKTFRSGSGDRLEFGPITLILKKWQTSSKECIRIFGWLRLD
jgi:hypothetical protein